MFGIDGILVESFEITSNQVKINCKIIKGKDYIIFKARDVPAESMEIILNNKSIGKKNKVELSEGFQFNL